MTLISFNDSANKIQLKYTTASVKLSDAKDAAAYVLNQNNYEIKERGASPDNAAVGATITLKAVAVKLIKHLILQLIVVQSLKINCFLQSRY